MIGAEELALVSSYQTFFKWAHICARRGNVVKKVVTYALIGDKLSTPLYTPTCTRLFSIP